MSKIRPRESKPFRIRALPWNCASSDGTVNPAGSERPTTLASFPISASVALPTSTTAATVRASASASRKVSTTACGAFRRVDAGRSADAKPADTSWRAAAASCTSSFSSGSFGSIFESAFVSAVTALALGPGRVVGVARVQYTWRASASDSIRPFRPSCQRSRSARPARHQIGVCRFSPALLWVCCDCNLRQGPEACALRGSAPRHMDATSGRPPIASPAVLATPHGMQWRACGQIRTRNRRQAKQTVRARTPERHSTKCKISSAGQTHRARPRPRAPGWPLESCHSPYNTGGSFHCKRDSTVGISVKRDFDARRAVRARLQPCLRVTALTGARSCLTRRVAQRSAAAGSLRHLPADDVSGEPATGICVAMAVTARTTHGRVGQPITRRQWVPSRHRPWRRTRSQRAGTAAARKRESVIARRRGRASRGATANHGACASHACHVLVDLGADYRRRVVRERGAKLGTRLGRVRARTSCVPRSRPDGISVWTRREPELAGGRV